MKTTAWRWAMAWTVWAAAVSAPAEIVVGGAVSVPGARASSGGAMAVPVPPGAVGEPPAALVPAQAAAAPGSDVLQFLNGDALHGELMGIGLSSNRVTWKHRGVAQPVDFDAAGVSEIRLAARAVEGRRPARGMVWLTNGDQFDGDIVSLDGTNLVLDTWYAGRLTVRRAMVARIAPQQTSSAVVYEGPKSLDEWSSRGGVRNKTWEFRNGGLYPVVPVPLGRIIENMPDTVRIDFDVAWRSRNPYFSFWFFHTNPDEPQGDAYYMTIMAGRRVELNRMRSNSGSQNLGSADIAQNAEDAAGKSRFSILADRTKGTIALLIDGTLVREWKDSKDFKAGGKALTFMPQSQRDLRFSNIRVSAWNGQVPQKQEAATVKEEDCVTLLNGDSLSGQILGIAGGQVKMKTSYATLDIPVARVSETTLAPGSSARARRRNGDVRARFADGGSVTMMLVRLGEGRIAGTSENWGEAQMPVSAFQSLELNIYQEKQAREENEF